MTGWRGLGWTGVAVALASWPVGTATAGHCEYCNEGLPTAVAIKTPEIGIDGVVVLVLEDARERALDEKSWGIATATVTDADGNAIEGSLEHEPGFSPAVWRPTAAWVPGTYEITVDVDLPSFPADPGPQDCSAFSHSAQIVVVDQARHVTGTQTLLVEETLGMAPSSRLDALVCCNQALPFEASLPGIVCPGYPSSEIQTWEGFCTERLADGWLDLTAEIRIDGNQAPPDYTMRETTRERTSAWGDASMSMAITKPECLEFEVLDLVTGERTTHASCHGDAVADELGPIELDPTATLTAMCGGGTPYVCESTGGSLGYWLETECTTWPDGEPYLHPAALLPGPPREGCRMGPTPSPGPSWLLALVILGARRLRRGLARVR